MEHIPGILASVKESDLTMRDSQRKPRRKRFIFLLMIFIALFCLSAYKVTTQLLTERKEKQAFSELIEQVNANRPPRRSQIAPESSPADESSAPAAEATPAPANQDGLRAVGPSQALATSEPEHTPSPANPDGIRATGSSQALATLEAEHTPAPETAISAPESTEAPAIVTPVPSPTEVPPMLAAYEPLYRKNHDLWGWLTIEDTAVNFPVMHTPRNPEYYLHRAFDRTSAFSGVPFMEARCYYGCGNYLIYGHHMKNGTMFADIVNYASEEFWQEHPLIYFDTLYEYGTYEVIAAFYSKLFPASDTDAFRYYYYTDLTDPAVFDEYVEQVLSAAVYDTGLRAAYGDQLLTLSTCEYSAKDNRFVVVARRID